MNEWKPIGEIAAGIVAKLEDGFTEGNEMCRPPKTNPNRRYHVMLRERDSIRLELIADTFGVSRSDAFRAALVAMSRQLGFEKEFSNDMLKNKLASRS